VEETASPVRKWRMAVTPAPPDSISVNARHLPSNFRHGWKAAKAKISGARRQKAVPAYEAQGEELAGCRRHGPGLVARKSLKACRKFRELPGKQH